jgi:hypothetical protein
MGYSGARGTLIYEKNLKAKISCQTPFNNCKLLTAPSHLFIRIFTVKDKYVFCPFPKVSKFEKSECVD